MTATGCIMAEMTVCSWKSDEIGSWKVCLWQCKLFVKVLRVDGWPISRLTLDSRYARIYTTRSDQRITPSGHRGFAVHFERAAYTPFNSTSAALSLSLSLYARRSS